MYNEKVMDIFKNAKNSGMIKNASGKGKVGNVQCGDIMQIYIAVDEKNVIRDAKFKTFGCVSAIASTDIMCDMIKGKTMDQALKISNKEVVDMLGGLPPQKIHCSVMAAEAVASAIKDCRKKQARAKARAK